MANWKTRLDLKDLKAQYEDDRITLQQFCSGVAKRLKALTLPTPVEERLRTERDEIVHEFELFGTDETTDLDDVDLSLDRLYDWGDIELTSAWPTDKLCWIEMR